jgi:hypothetical protein
MVALAPGADIVPTTYHPKYAENGISPFNKGISNQKVTLKAVDITPPEYDSADPVVITSNGSGTTNTNNMCSTTPSPLRSRKPFLEMN